MSVRDSILIVADGLPAGGTERQIVEMLRGFEGHPHFRVGLCILRRGGQREPQARKHAGFIAEYPKGFWAEPWALLSFVQWIKKEKVQVLHSFGARSDWVSILAAKLSGAAVINGSIRSARPRLNRIDIVCRLSMPWADRIIANSRAGLDAFGLQRHPKAKVIYNGIDFRRFRRWQSTDAEPGRICMVANFSRKKDQPSLIKAVEMVRQKQPQVKLTLVGRGGKRLAYCKALIRERRLDHVVEIVSDCNDPEPLIAKSELGVLVTSLENHGEGISNAIMEYMALGKPVLANNSGGNREVILDHVTGLLIDDNNPRTIASALNFLLERPEQMREMGRRGKSRIRERFDIESMISSYEALYRDVLQKDG